MSAGIVKWVSSGQKIGHIIGCPPRLICRQPPASVASFVAHQTPDACAGLQLGMLVRDLQHDRFDGRAGETVLRVLRVPTRQVHGGPVFDRAVDLPE